MNIGEAARASGVSAKMIRYYEAIGLIPAAGRSGAGYRTYSPTDIRMLRFIRRARDLGFPVPAIHDLLALWRDRSRHSGDVKHLAEAHIATLTQRIAEMQAMRDTLDHLARSCHGDARPDCPILADLEGEGARPAPAGPARPGAPPRRA
jgi:MerR family gold-responsive transcriptional activator of gol and ges genes